jgi:signal transduction histidine kinase
MSSVTPSPLARFRHDLRTPINQILGYSELLIEEVGDAGHGEAYAPDLHKIRRAGQQLLTLINENLTDARVTLAPPSAGTTFQEFASASPLPVAVAPPLDVAALLAASVSDSADAPVADPGRILVVDDEPASRDVLTRQLTRQGHTVGQAEHGEAALARLHAEPFDLVLLDMMMPVLDGFSTLRALKTDPALRHLPVIMISALDELPAVVKCIENGAEDFVPKPFNPTLLRARIGTGLQKKRFRDQEAALLLAREAAEEAYRTKSAFLANLSHELRTPMNAIIGYSEMLIEEAADSNYDSAIPDLKKIHAAGKHLLGLINDLLDISELEAGKMTLYLEDALLPDLLDEIASTIRPLVAANHNTLVLEPAADLGILHADVTKVRQTLFNLLSNAAKFTHHGRITLAVTVSPRDGRDFVHFRVADTGIGMTEAQLARIFQAFVQADASTTRKYGCLGLGLALSQKFCQLMGGDIAVESRPGHGTVFTASIPLHVEDPAKSRPPSSKVGGASCSPPPPEPPPPPPPPRRGPSSSQPPKIPPPSTLSPATSSPTATPSAPPPTAAKPSPASSSHA